MNSYIYKILIRILPAAVALAGFAGCIREDLGSPKPGELAVRVQLYIQGSPSTRAGNFADDLIETIDVLSFNEGTGKFQYRATAYAIDENNRWFDIVLSKSRDEYQRLIVLANLSDELDALTLTPGVTDTTQLQQNLKFDLLHRKEHGGIIDGTKEFGDGRLLPMCGRSEPLAIVQDKMDIGTIYMLRSLATVSVRIDLDENDPAQKPFELVDVVIYNTPAQGHAIPAPGTLGKDDYITDAPKAKSPSVVAGTTYSKAYYVSQDGETLVRKIFIGERDNDTDGSKGLADKDKSWLVIGGRYDGDTEVTWYRMPFTDKNGKEWDILRNHDYIFNITAVKGRGSSSEEGLEIEVELDVRNWEPQSLYPAGGAELNVSAVSASVNERNMARIYFWSNRKKEEISVYPQTGDGEDVDDIFYGLIGTTDAQRFNFHYDYDPVAGEGAGYIDLITDHGKGAGISGKTHSIFIDAAGLKREVAVDVNLMGSALSVHHNYVGAFWRSDQRGERVIAMPNNGAWSLNINYSPGAEAGWVALASGKSMDPKLWSGEDSDAEEYPVEGGATTVSGSGDIYFRIGCNSFHAGDEPRYARLVLTTTSGTKYIYLRQGEQPDYVMRPDDYSTWGEGEKRVLAAKYSPFNLTALDYKYERNNASHYVQIDKERTNAVFTEYPSQGGAYFQWGSDENPRYAWNSSANVAVPELLETYPTTFWDVYREDNETCPPGYRRPADGSISEVVAPDNVNLDNSEQRQSLWLNPPLRDYSNDDNVLTGYLADGFFDRHPVTTPGCNLSGTYSSVRNGYNDAAYMGSLFFNPYNYASLFFPAAGARFDMDTYIYYQGNYGHYWTATIGSVSHNKYTPWNMWFTKNNKFHSLDIMAPEAISIRCVVDAPPFVDRISDRFARSNIVYKDGKLTFAVTEADNLDIPANVQGLYFKFGSLIGIGQTRTTWAGREFTFTPAGYTGTVSTFQNIPHYEKTKTVYALDDYDFADIGNGAGFDAASGMGDICRYISAQNWVEGKWRIPTVQELLNLYHSTPVKNGVDGSQGRFHGINVDQTLSPSVDGNYGMGLVDGAWWFGHGVYEGIELDAVADANKRVPPPSTFVTTTSGYLLVNGSVGGIGKSGHFPSSTKVNESNFGALFIDALRYTVYPPTTGVVVQSGLPIRCIRED